MRIERAILAVFALVLFGCQDAPIEWEYQIETGVTDPVWIGASIRPGSTKAVRSSFPRT